MRKLCWASVNNCLLFAPLLSSLCGLSVGHCYFACHLQCSLLNSHKCRRGNVGLWLVSFDFIHVNQLFWSCQKYHPTMWKVLHLFFVEHIHVHVLTHTHILILVHIHVLIQSMMHVILHEENCCTIQITISIKNLHMW